MRSLSVRALIVALSLVSVLSGCFRSPSTGAGRLLQAMDSDDHGALLRSLESGADPNGKDWDGDPLLIYALYDGDEFAVQKLLEYGADPQVVYEDESALHIGVGISDAISLALLDHGAALLPGEDTSALAHAASTGSLETLKRLLATGANPNPPDEGDWHPLVAACEAGEAEAYSLLVAGGAKAPAEELIDASFASGNPEFVDGLLAAYPDTPLPPGWLPTAIVMKAREPTRSWIEKLIAARGRPSQEDLSTALLAVAYANDPVLIAYTIELGADVTRGAPLMQVVAGVTDSSETRAPAALASLDVLIQAGVDPDAWDGDAARSALMTAVEAKGWEGKPEFITRLLQSGASVDLQDAAGQSALHLAAGRGDPPLTRLLVEAGADRALRDGEGRTPADLARDRRPKNPEDADKAARMFLKAMGMGKMFEIMRERYDEVLRILGEDPRQEESIARSG